jgi:Phosphodiester glycosidase
VPNERNRGGAVAAVIPERMPTRAVTPVSRTLLQEAKKKKKRRRQVRRRRAVALLVLFSVPVVYSYVSTMLQPSSLPLGIRSVEWLRMHGAAWFVNDAERLYYNWKAPAKGGPALRTLPRVGSAPAPGAALAYRPKPIAPLIQPRLAGEGLWRSTGRLVNGVAPVLVTTFRADPVYPRIVADVAWFDHTRTQLALYPGRYEPPAANPRGPMQVPQSQRWRLLATFNSGFLHRDSGGGFSVNGHTAQPLRKGQGTIVAYRDGRVNIISWNRGPTPPADVVLAQQNLPLIVSNGRPNPLLSDGALWGATLGNAVRVWRSGAGIDRHGNLIYAAANDQTAPSIAAILIRAGAIRAIELDINAEWPTLITYGSGGTRNATKVVPNTQQPSNRYLVPDDRNFFAIYKRTTTTTTALTSVPFG